MNFKFDVSAIGELLIDFTQIDAANDLFGRNPGGAPANVLAALSKFNKKTAFIGKVGKDMFGDYLKSVLDSHDIDTSGLLQTSKYNTTLAFVKLDENGERSFSFYRNPGADLMIYPFDVKNEIIEQSRIFHFGSVSMTGIPARDATLGAAEYAKKLGKIVSYDPNLRIRLWSSAEEARKYILEGMKYADVLKISDDEFEFLLDDVSLAEGAKLLAQSFDIKLVVVTRGAKGSYYKCGEFEGELPTLKIDTVDTTGAGDAFTAGLLNKLTDKGMERAEDFEKLTKEDLEECVKFGLAVGSLCTKKKGAIPAMPELDEVLEAIKTFN